ncbi:MAG: nucleotide excision repair endonuclease, partial [Rhodothermaceae bacterium]|nr:nucleotide excision repair endonuclease [Rhodothermaceae bacterium]
KPGIYRFYDVAGSLLYVGKASDLRKRLASYRRARAGKVPRKVSGLVSRIRRIETEVHASSDEALLAENRWIRSERPPYNHANKHTETYYYVLIDFEDDDILFRLTMNPERQEPSALCFGCFKGHIRVRRMLGSLLRLLWLAVNRATSPHFLPVQLTRRITPMNYRLRFPGASGTAGLTGVPTHPLLVLIRDWFDGQSDELLHRLAWWNRGFCMDSPFNRLFLEEALSQIDSFFNGVLHPHCRIRETLLNGRPTISRDELDDLLYRAKKEL